MQICKIGGTFYSDFQNFQVSHPGVVGPRKSGFQKCPSPPPPPPGEVLVIFLYYLRLGVQIICTH